jgi:4-amino-4-deoxy-L-arabinose transferase-like glycosyltransferase
MALKPEYGVMSGLTVGAVVFAIHTQATPSQADIQALPAGNKDVDSAERKATYLSAGVVAGISLLAKDPTIFIIGAAATLAMAVWTRHSNWTESGAKYLSPAASSSAGSANTGPAMDTHQAADTTPYTMYSGGGASEFVGS